MKGGKAGGGDEELGASGMLEPLLELKSSPTRNPLVGHTLGHALAHPLSPSALLDPPKSPPKPKLLGFLSGLAYCLASCSMILLNKLVLSGYNWKAHISLMLFQNLVTVVAVLLLAALRVIRVEPFTRKLVAVWFPVNLVFVGMLVTSFFGLQNMQVAMVTILKSCTNLFIALGDVYLFSRPQSSFVWLSLLLMVLSAVSGGLTDLSFSAVGYSWQLLNCAFTAVYALLLRRVMDVAKAATQSGELNEFSMVLLNNTLSLPLGLVLMLSLGEVPYIMASPLLLDRGFWLACTLSGLFGLSISFTSMWFLHQTSPTTYSLVGSLNKIPLSILGILVFRAPTTIYNISSILIGLWAGVMFAYSKLREK